MSCIGPADIRWYVEQGYGDPFELRPQTEQPLVINAALTGNVPTKDQTPHVPITSDEIVEDACRCFEAGATVLHLHARDSDGAPTYRKEAYEEFIPEIRRRCPDVVICATTSGRLFNSLPCRSQVLDLEGDAKPDMASLTLGSMNFPKQASVNSPDMITALALRMQERRIMPELEVFEVGMINYALYLEKRDVLHAPHWFNLLLGSLGTIPARLADLDYLVQCLPEACHWGGAGIGRFQLPINIVAILKGGNVRLGLEDNIYCDAERTRLATNELLVQRLADFSRSIGRPIATAKQTRRIIGLDAWRQRCSGAASESRRSVQARTDLAVTG